MSDRDTKGAEGDLHMAISYLKDRQKANANDYPLRAMLLDKATKYVVSAREKDPEAIAEEQLTSVDITIPRTADDLSAEILFQQYLVERLFATLEKKPRAALLKAKGYLDRSFAYNSKYHTFLPATYCDLLLDLHDQPGALKIAKENVEKNPDPSTYFGLDARKLLDRTEGSPITREPTYFEKNPHNLVSLIQIGLLALTFVFFALAVETAWQYVYLMGLTIAVFCGYNWYQNRKDYSKMFGDALDERIRRDQGRR